MIHVIDNFLKDPHQVRSKGLKLHYKKGDYYPGYRSFEVDEYIKKNIISYSSKITNETLRIQKSAEGFDNCCYQYVTKKFQTGNFHTDFPTKYTCILFLTPEPPKNSGLEICDYDFKDTKWTKKFRDTKFNFIKNPDSLSNKIKYKISAHKYNQRFDPMIKVNNKFNRMVVFDGGLFHKQQNYFGSSAKDSRMTIATFLI
jgi:hypothetical protein